GSCGGGFPVVTGRGSISTWKEERSGFSASTWSPPVTWGNFALRLATEKWRTLTMIWLWIGSTFQVPAISPPCDCVCGCVICADNNSRARSYSAPELPDVPRTARRAGAAAVGPAAGRTDPALDARAAGRAVAKLPDAGPQSRLPGPLCSRTGGPDDRRDARAGRCAWSALHVDSGPRRRACRPRRPPHRSRDPAAGRA